MALQLPGSLNPSTLAAINSIIEAYDTENLRRALAIYPERIAEQKKKVNAARKVRTDAETARATAEAELRLTILAETSDSGKAKWGNVEARDAELIRRKGVDPMYRDAMDVLYKAEAALQEEADALAMLQDQYQGARIAGRLIAAELAAFSEIIDVGEASEISSAGALAEEFGNELPTAVGAEKGRFVPQRSKSKEAF